MKVLQISCKEQIMVSKQSAISILVCTLQPSGTSINCAFAAVDPEGLSITYTMSPYSPYFAIDPSPSPHIETTMPLYINQMPQTTNTFSEYIYIYIYIYIYVFVYIIVV